MKKLIAYMLMITSILSCIVPISAATKKSNKPKITAKAAIVMDAQTGQVLYNKNMNKIKYPASLTKLMTVLLTLENCSLNEKVKFSDEAVFGIERGSSSIGIEPDEILTIRECLYGMMLESANEVCSAVAEHISGSVEDFSKLMTTRAKELGCKNTNFMNANGLHDDKHFTTAYDMALILKEALKHKEFRTIAATRSHKIPKTNLNPARELWNHHKMIKYPNGTYSIKPLELTSGKTAFTTKAKTCLSTSATDGNMELICIVLDDAGSSVYVDTQTLFNYIYKNYQHYYPLENYNTMPAEESNLIAHNYFQLVNPEKLKLNVDTNYVVTLPKNADLSKLQTHVQINFDNETKTLGDLYIMYNGTDLGSTPIYFEDFTAPSYVNTHTNTTINSYTQYIIIGIILFVAFIICILFFRFYIRLRRNRNSLRFDSPKRHRRNRGGKSL